MIKKQVKEKPLDKQHKGSQKYYGKDRSSTLILIIIIYSVCSMVLFYCTIYLLIHYGYMDFNVYHYFDIFFVALLFVIGPYILLKLE